MPEKIENRRSFIKYAGSGIMSAMVAGTATAKKGDNNDDSPDDGVSTEYIGNAQGDFSPATISLSETSSQRSTWSITGSDYYQLDAVVEADNIEQPVITGSNMGNITKRFVHVNDSVLGEAYHFQAKGFFTAPSTRELYVEARVTPTSTGRVDANTGTYWPVQSWATSTLYVE